MPLPTGGLCVTEDGSLADTHWHTRRPGVSNSQTKQHQQQARDICMSCPVLAECRDYAALSKWQTVTVAGWSAPSKNAEYPPWAVIRCTLCGREQEPSERYAQRCVSCREWLESQAHHRWMAYVGEVRVRRDTLPV